MLSKVLLLAVPVQVATSDTFPTECYGVPDNTACSQYHQLGVENVAYVCSQVDQEFDKLGQKSAHLTI